MADKLTDADLITILREEERRAWNDWQDRLQSGYLEALNRYDRRPYGDEQEGQSKVVTSEFADTIESIMPSLMRVFASGDSVFEFSPMQPGDEVWAEQASQYVPHVLMRENDGFRILHWFFKDALMYRRSGIHVDVEERETTRTDPVENWTAEQLAAAEMAAQEAGATDVTIEVEPDQQKVAKASVDYSPGMGEDRCANCSHYLGGACELVDGEIDPSYWCKLFEMRQPGSVPMVQETFSGTITLTRTKKRVIPDNVAPEDILISPDARDVDQASFAGYRKQTTASELRKLGLSQDEIDELSSDSPETIEEDERQDGLTAIQRSYRKDSERRLWIVVGYVKADANGDGISEMLRVVYAHAGGSAAKIIDRREWEEPEAPITLGTPILMSHMIDGRSLFDQTADLQDIGTALTRGMLDNLYYTNRPRPAINERVSVTSVLDWVPGMPITVRGGESPAQSITWMKVPNIIAPAQAALEYMATVRENRTGVTRYNQGLDSESLNKTATGINMIMSSAQARQELMAMVFGQMALTRLAKHIYRAIKRAATGKVKYYDGEDWAECDPTKWPDDMHLIVSAGTGNRMQEMQNLMLIGQGQQALIQAQGGPGGPVVKLEHAANTFRKLVEAAGFRATSQFVASPKELEQEQANPKPAPPSPEMMKVQAEAQAKQAQLQADQQLGQQKLQAEIQLKRMQSEADVALRTEQAAIDMQLAREKHQQDMQLAREKAALDAELKKMELTAEAALEKYRVDNEPDPNIKERSVSND